jgi:hypothetical protein
MSYWGFKLLKILVFDLLGDVFRATLQKKNQMGGKSGDIGGHAIGAPRPIHQPNMVGRNG